MQDLIQSRSWYHPNLKTLLASVPAEYRRPIRCNPVSFSEEIQQMFANYQLDSPIPPPLEKAKPVHCD